MGVFCASSIHINCVSACSGACVGRICIYMWYSLSIDLYTFTGCVNISVCVQIYVFVFQRVHQLLLCQAHQVPQAHLAPLVPQVFQVSTDEYKVVISQIQGVESSSFAAQEGRFMSNPFPNTVAEIRMCLFFSLSFELKAAKLPLKHL